MAILVIDPGHGGTSNASSGQGDNSTWNNATSASGVLEKNITLDIAKRLRWSLVSGSGKAYADSQGKSVTVKMTRDSDVNLGLFARAEVAADHDADLFLSIHCNGLNGAVRGTEAWVDRKYMQPKQVSSAGTTVNREGPGIPSSGRRNLNPDADAAFGHAVAKAVVDALNGFEPGAKLRSDSYSAAQNGEAWSPPPGVKMKALSVLRDSKLGTSANQCKACLLELEFIDHPKVDALLNGARASQVRNAIASALARAVVDSV
jgi:N-acetylmuramoyl-L-alanine amidase